MSGIIMTDITYEQIRIIAALVMLGGASGLDIWKREVHDYYWIGFGAIAAIITVISFSFEDLFQIGYAMIIAPIAIIVWRMGLFGGADAFALIVLAGLAPLATLSNNPVTPFSTLSNAAILVIIPLATNIARNAIALARGEKIFDDFEESMSKKIIASMIGHKSKNPKFGFSIESQENGKKKFSLGMHHAEDTEYCTTKDTWITQGIPYMLLIAGGFAIQVFFGDIILSLFM